MLNEYLKLTRLDRPVGSLLLLWPTLAALWMAAAGQPPFYLIIVFTLGTLLMRSAGCVINDYADRKVDGSVKRTKDRPLVTGTIRPSEALRLFFALLAGAGLLAMNLNQQTLLLAVGGAAVATLYPFMKRWTHLPQVVLGAAFSWGILMAWTAQDKSLAEVSWLLFFSSLLWIVAYDTLYAMVDRDDDLIVGIKSTAILFGDLDRLIIGILQCAALLGFILTGLKLGYEHLFFVAMFCIACLFIYQQWLIRDRGRDGSFAAFRNNIWVGVALFGGTVSELALRGWLSA